MLELLTKGFGIFVIAFLGGVAGAVSKHILGFLGKRSEQRVASWDVLEKLAAEALSDIRELSILYWGQKESAELKPTSARIVALCDAVPGLYLQLFQNDQEIQKQLDVRMSDLADVITGGSFQQADRIADQTVIARMETELLALGYAIRINRAKMSYPWC